jgi:neutral ceramidase
MAAVTFGVATRDVTPPFAVMLGGYANRDHQAHAVSERIQLSALCLQGRNTEGRSRLVVLAMDTIGVRAADVQILQAEVEKECGLRREELLIAASHTHFAPFISPQRFPSPELGILEPDPRYVSLVRRAAVEAVRQSCETLTLGELQVHRMDVPAILFNRRTILRASGSACAVETNFLYPGDPALYEFSPVDPQLSVLRIVADGAPRVALANFGCHPVTGGMNGPGSHYDVSADYPHYLRDAVSRAWGCPTLFTLGAAGDSVPLQRAGLSRKRIGATLGNSILLAERAFVACGEAGQEVLIARRAVRMEARTILRTRGTDAEKQYESARASMQGKKPGEATDLELQHFQATMLGAFRARLYPEDKATIEVAMHRIGDIVLVAFPFEVLSGVALLLKKVDPRVVLVSAANGYEGYLPQAFEYERGGYEATTESTSFEPGTMDRLLEKISKELERI